MFRDVEYFSKYLFIIYISSFKNYLFTYVLIIHEPKIFLDSKYEWGHIIFVFLGLVVVPRFYG